MLHCDEQARKGTCIRLLRQDIMALGRSKRAPIGAPIRGQKLWVRCFAVNSDGKVIVSGSEDSTIRRCDSESRTPIGYPL